ncbi:Cyclohexadienyl dehydrogenase [BD1-7 clade bacterium]|uniref:prephenate dehydrogenase n=1 Tax=BD1-7 clade bacterium TaxID=2029982 RepID=A0A5S9PAZ8_9GAMM|nr:Cyclohexadienyl dehydrogenase [BD1-7 clade bacterium]
MLANTILIIGTGLIGGSFAKGLKQRNLIRCAIGYGRRYEQLELGIELAVIDEAARDLPQAIARADVIVLGVPTLTVADYLDVIAEHRKADSVVTDVASVKGEIAHVIREHYGVIPPWFVLGHPIAGSEKSGITASNSDLYVHHKVILTPEVDTDENALALIRALWEGVGADVVCMGIDEHDRVLAATSHLPHALAFSLVDCLQAMDANVDVFRFAAGGFRDFTRIAGSHPVMWHDIMLANKSAILEMMGEFKATLSNLENAIENDDSDTILAMFERAKASREHFAGLIDAASSTESNAAKSADLSKDKN